jgi:hypothetical protein
MKPKKGLFFLFSPQSAIALSRNRRPRASLLSIRRQRTKTKKKFKKKERNSRAFERARIRRDLFELKFAREECVFVRFFSLCFRKQRALFSFDQRESAQLFFFDVGDGLCFFSESLLFSLKRRAIWIFGPQVSLF